MKRGSVPSFSSRKTFNSEIKHEVFTKDSEVFALTYFSYYLRFPCKENINLFLFLRFIRECEKNSYDIET